MPVLNGLETARELKKIMPDVPIILFTQHAHASKGLSSFQMIVDRIVPKTDARALDGTCERARTRVDRALRAAR